MARRELRYAIWLAYEKRDVYGGRLIENFSDLEVDHIIPKSTDSDTLKLKIDKYELGSDFYLDSIENLIPTSRIHNRQKSEMGFNESSERFFLAIAAGRKARVEEELSRVIENFRIKEKSVFREHYEVVDTGSYAFRPTYFNCKTLVELTGFLPSRLGVMGCCNIEFYEVGSSITLEHESIMQLAEAIEYSTLEKEISYFYDDKTASGFIKLASTSLRLKKDAYYELLSILNDFLLVYLDFSGKWEDFFGIRDLQMISNEIYLLKEINEEEGQYLLDYAYHHDMGIPGESEFHFNASRNCLIALNKDDSTIRFRISYRINKWALQKGIMLLWHLPSLMDRKFIESGKVWTATQTLNWVDEMLSKPREIFVTEPQDASWIAEPTLLLLWKKCKNLISGLKKFEK